MQGAPEVQKYFKKFNQSRNSFIKTTTLARSYLYHILEQVEKRKLPGELALLPMLESNFQPHAISNRGAVGLWQFMPATGRQLGLKQRAGYDGRKDVKASTTAALNYLEYLHKKFNRDWMLALAAYNAGEGTVERAIKRNKKTGKPTSFWFLKLPKQTREYVPKFLALAQMIR
jgi:membrane-bound lytic murein transglycosylase D